MKTGKALTGGLAGAVLMTLVHNYFKANVKDAPRIDELGMEALKKIFGKDTFSDKDELYQLSILSDLLSNGLAYSLAATSKKYPVWTGTFIGGLIGLATTNIPQRLGLKKDFAAKTLKTALMSIAYYSLGGLTSGAIIKNQNK